VEGEGRQAGLTLVQSVTGYPGRFRPLDPAVVAHGRAIRGRVFHDFPHGSVKAGVLISSRRLLGARLVTMEFRHVLFDSGLPPLDAPVVGLAGRDEVGGDGP